MLPAVIGLASGGLAIKGGLGNLLTNVLPFAADLFGRKDQQSFQERMANTTYQRAVADMRKAGLNPMLAYKQGGAPSPGGASTSSSGAAVAQGISTAMQLRRQKEELQNMRATRKNIEQQTRKIGEETKATTFDNEKRRVISEFWRLGGEALEEFNRRVETQGMGNAIIWGLAYLAKTKAGGKKGTKKVMTRRGTRRKKRPVDAKTNERIGRARRGNKTRQGRFNKETGEIYGE